MGLVVRLVAFLEALLVSLLYEMLPFSRLGSEIAVVVIALPIPIIAAVFLPEIIFSIPVVPLSVSASSVESSASFASLGIVPFELNLSAVLLMGSLVHCLVLF